MKQVSDLARLFGVDRDTVKKWCYTFSEYLSDTASPSKGQTRLFTDADLQVLALIYYYWEDEPDYEHIRSCLDAGYHNLDIYLEFLYLNTPIFKEPPNDIEEKPEYSIMLNGEFLRSPLDVARAYRMAGDALVAQAIAKEYYPYELDYPIFFTYRHSIELYLKILVGYNIERGGIHNLSALITDLETKYNKKLPGWMRDRLNEFYDIDPGSLSFRYAGSMSKAAQQQLVWIDLYQLRAVMRIMCDAFEKIIGLP